MALSLQKLFAIETKDGAIATMQGDLKHLKGRFRWQNPGLYGRNPR